VTAPSPPIKDNSMYNQSSTITPATKPLDLDSRLNTESLFIWGYLGACLGNQETYFQMYKMQNRPIKNYGCTTDF
jgi:hypothetical protein